VRGHLLTTRGQRLEDVGQADFIDIVYSYSVNSPELRNDFRSAMVGYMFEITTEEERQEDMTFTGFTKQSINMLDELDAFRDGLG
jgi:hypothetical protein